MKNRFVVFGLFIILLLNIHLSAFASSEKPDLYATSAALIDLSNEHYLFKSNIQEPIAPGGLVKLMTAIVAIEHISDTSATITVSADAISSYDYSFGNMGILANEDITYEDLLHGLLIYDAGDAAEVLASTVVRSREKFIIEMNNKAVEIGALNTKFTNPTGFPDKNQYSTVEDLYKITKYAMANPYLRDIMGKARYEMAPTNKYSKNRYLDNKNKFMSATSTDKYYTTRAKGVKNSYIDDDNCSLILNYETDSVKFLTIVCESIYDGELNHAYEDTKKLLDYGLNYYSSVKIINEGDILAEVELTNAKNTDRLLLEATKDIYVNLPANYNPDKLETKVKLNEKIKAPLVKGQKLGEITILYDGEVYASEELLCPSEIKSNHLKGIFKKVASFLTSPILLVSLGIMLIIFVWSILIFNKKKTYKLDKKINK